MLYPDNDSYMLFHSVIEIVSIYVNFAVFSFVRGLFVLDCPCSLESKIEITSESWSSYHTTMSFLRRSRDAKAANISTPLTNGNAILSKPTSAKNFIPDKVIRAIEPRRAQAPQELSFSKGDFFFVTRELEYQRCVSALHTKAGCGQSIINLPSCADLDIVHPGLKFRIQMSVQEVWYLKMPLNSSANTLRRASQVPLIPSSMTAALATQILRRFHVFHRLNLQYL